MNRIPQIPKKALIAFDKEIARDRADGMLTEPGDTPQEAAKNLRNLEKFLKMRRCR